MHTLQVISGGFALLGLLLFLGHRQCGGRSGLAVAALWFVPLWFVGAGINLAVGVLHAGFTVRQEAPIFLVVFGTPTAVALFVWRRTRPRA